MCVCSVTFNKMEVINLCQGYETYFLRGSLVKQFGFCPVGGLGGPIREACVVDCHQLCELGNFGNGELPSP